MATCDIAWDLFVHRLAVCDDIWNVLVEFGVEVQRGGEVGHGKDARPPCLHFRRRQICKLDHLCRVAYARCVVGAVCVCVSLCVSVRVSERE